MKLVFVVLLFCVLVAGESIVSLILNKPEGQIYALSSGNWLYELDNVQVSQNNFHKINSPSQPAFSSSFLKSVNGKKYLFQGLSDLTTYQTYLSSFELPFNNKPILSPSRVSDAYGYSTIPTFFDNQDSLAVTISNQDFLNLFDLVTVNKTAAVKAANGARRAATAVLYNTKTNRAVVFGYLFLYSGRRYSLEVSEYIVDNNKKSLTRVDSSTFPIGDTHFNNTRANSAAFDSSNNKYWILDDVSNNLIRFNSGNMAVYTIIPLGAVTFENGMATAVYDFGSQIAYVLSDAPNGFYLQEVDLVSGKIRRAGTFNTQGLFATSAYLDSAEGNLYVGLLNDAVGTPGRLSVIDLGNLSQRLIVLTH